LYFGGTSFATIDIAAHAACSNVQLITKLPQCHNSIYLLSSHHGQSIRASQLLLLLLLLTPVNCRCYLLQPDSLPVSDC